MKKNAIPGKLNLLLMVSVFAITILLLWTASHAPFSLALIAAWLFSIFNNTAFSLLHESVHGIFSKNHKLNEIAGKILAVLFPTSLTLQRIAHLGHHQRNRTDQELYDYYLPTQSRTLRNIWLYGGNLLGFYWFLVLLSNFIYLVAPWIYISKWFRRGPARYLGFEPFVKEIAQHPPLVIWSECLLAFTFHFALFWLLDLTIAGWLLCYWAFALHWSALQYVDHAWSPRNIINGAWNLKVSALSRALALNYHYHLAHHQHPQLPWIHLPHFVDKSAKQPGFWQIYFSLWKGVKLAPPMS